LSSFWRELRRRKVFKVGVAYAISAWIIAQIVTLVKEPLHLPAWFDTAIIVLLIAGFPIALILAWVFDITPQGIARTGAEETAPDVAPPASGSASPTHPAFMGQSQESIAVLPFVNMSSDPEQEYFSDGISEELLNQLARIPDLHVAGRTSSFSFKGKNQDLRLIGQQLNVAHILEGSVRKSGNRVRVTAQLIKAADGYHLWSQSYDRDLHDIFAIQDEIAQAVSSALSIALGVGNLGVSTRNVDAYDAYLSSLASFGQGGRENWSRAIDQLQQATKLDPDFVEAWAMLANVALSGSSVYLADRAAELLELAERAGNRAIATAPDSEGALRAKGILEGQRLNWSLAGEALWAALERAPSNPQTLQAIQSFLFMTGRLREGVEYGRKWARLEPLYVNPIGFLGIALELVGDLDGAEAAFKRAGLLGGGANSYAGPALSVALTRGDRAAITPALDAVLATGLAVPGHQEVSTTMRDCLDDPQAARKALHGFAQNPAYANPLMRSVMAAWASYFGDDELALNQFRSLKAESSLAGFILWRPLHSKMRQLPGFKDLLRERGLVDYWRQSGVWGDHCRPLGDDDFTCS